MTVLFFLSKESFGSVIFHLGMTKILLVRKSRNPPESLLLYVLLSPNRIKLIQNFLDLIRGD
jgi:hypothetical protein